MLFKAKDIYESLNFSVILIFKEGRQSVRGLPAFIVFTFSLAEIRLCRTDVRRRNGYSTTLRIFIYSGMLKKHRPKILLQIKVFADNKKVFEHLFQKVPRSRARRHCRAPRSAKAPIGVFFFVAFSFAPALPKEKADGEFAFSFVC